MAIVVFVFKQMVGYPVVRRERFGAFGVIIQIPQKKIPIQWGAVWSYLPIGSMYAIFTYIWKIFRANVGKYAIHGASGDIF